VLNCAAFRSRIAHYISGQLQPSEHDAVEAHLETCKTCLIDVTAARLIPAESDMHPVGEDKDATREAEDSAVIKIAHSIILQGIQEGAAEIRLEPEPRGVRVCYSHAENSNDSLIVPKYLESPLIDRFLKMASLSSSQLQQPQEGHIPIRSNATNYDITLATVPLQDGVRLIIRIRF